MTTTPRIMTLVWTLKLLAMASFVTLVDATCTGSDEQIVLEGTLHHDTSTENIVNDIHSKSSRPSSQVRFPDVILPDNTDFLDATLRLHVDGTVVGHRMTYSLRRALDEKEQLSSTLEPSFRIFEAKDTLVEVDVTGDVENWIRGTEMNEGWFIVGKTESSLDASSVEDTMPRLTVRYCPSSPPPMDKKSPSSRSVPKGRGPRVHKGGSKRVSRGNAPLTTSAKKRLGLDHGRSLKDHKKGENYFEFSWGGKGRHHRRDEHHGSRHHHRSGGVSRLTTNICLLPPLLFGAFYAVF